MILDKQTLKVPKVLSFRAKLSLAEFNLQMLELENFIIENDFKETSNRFSAIYSTEGDLVDMEIFIPVDKTIDVPRKYNFQDEFLLVNALKYSIIGSPESNQESLMKLKKYMEERKLVQKSPIYSVTITNLNSIKTIEQLKKIEVDIYVGVE